MVGGWGFPASSSVGGGCKHLVCGWAGIFHALTIACRCASSHLLRYVEFSLFDNLGIVYVSCGCVHVEW